MRRCIKLVPALAASLAFAIPAPAMADARCGSFLVDHGAYRVIAYRNSKIRCRLAMRIVREFRLYGRIRGSDEPWRLPRFPGWRCSEGAGGGTCTRGAQAAYWSVLNHP